MSSVLLLRPDKAGDLIKSLPAIRALSKALPGIKIHILTSQANHSLLEFEPNLTYSTLPQDWTNLSKEELSALLKQITGNTLFNHAINLLCDPFEEAERLVSLSPAQDRFSILSESLPIGVWPIQLKKGSPANRDESLNIAEIIEHSLETTFSQTLSTSDYAPKLGRQDSHEAEINLGKKMGQWLAVCPFAGTANRTHSTKKWERFIKMTLGKSNLEKVVLFGAPSDCETMEGMKKALGNPGKLQLAIPSSFRALGAYLKRCDRVVAVDSGPLHFSLALGIPSLGFLSGGDRVRWFSRTTQQDKILPRGLFNRYPSFLEMWWHFSHWA